MFNAKTMSVQKFDSEKLLFEKLASKNTSEVHDALLKIRKYYVRNQHKMRKLQQYPIVESIIPHLEHPKFCITSLSIIMEGCLEYSFVNDVIKHNGVQSLMRIMKSCVNDDIQSRACRALGNIAKFSVGYKAVHLTKPVSSIVHYLSESNDAICQIAAVRTLMILGGSTNTREMIVRENGLVYIAKLLHSSDVNVLISSTKALANLTQNCSIFCARQLLEGNCLEVFIKLHSHSEKNIRNSILVLLQNLTAQEEIRANLVKAGVIKLFTEVLSHKSDEMIPTAALALCNCLDHIHMWSHNGTDRAVGLKALILVLQNKKYEKIHWSIIVSLIPLSYESKVSDILLSLNLLPVLTQILKDFIEKYKCKSLAKILHKSDYNFECDITSNEPKSIEKCNFSSSISNVIAYEKGGVSSFADSCSYYSFLSKAVVGYKNSLTKNECNSPLHFDTTDSDTSNKKLKVENDKNSEAESHVPNIFASMNTGRNIELSNTVYNSYKSKAKQLNENPELQTIDHYTLLFMLQLSFHTDKNPNSQIADKNCFSVLMDYLCFIHNPSFKAETVLLNLVKNRYCFEKLVLNGFICELEDKLGHVTFYGASICFQSKNFSCHQHAYVKAMYANLIQAGRLEAESDFGVGTLSHILTTSEKTGQLYAICALSKLVREKSALYRLLFQANGMSLLLNFLSDSSYGTRIKAVISVCEVYQSLTKEQKKEKCCFLHTCKLNYSKNCSYDSSSFDIAFSVNGDKVLANKKKICKNSEYFSALLSGHFLESQAEVITLPDISAESLTVIFHFLHGCGSQALCPYIRAIPFPVLLQLLSDCDRFLLMNIKAYVEDKLCHSLCPLKLSKIYIQSKIHNSPALAKRSLDYALKLDVLKKNILLNCFEELFHLESHLNLLGDIESLLKSSF